MFRGGVKSNNGTVWEVWRQSARKKASVSWNTVNGCITQTLPLCLRGLRPSQSPAIQSKPAISFRNSFIRGISNLRWFCIIFSEFKRCSDLIRAKQAFGHTVHWWQLITQSPRSFYCVVGCKSNIFWASVASSKDSVTWLWKVCHKVSILLAAMEGNADCVSLLVKIRNAKRSLP